jgi:hypothetical protein
MSKIPIDFEFSDTKKDTLNFVKDIEKKRKESFLTLRAKLQKKY